jgi:hypothetical protein
MALPVRASDGPVSETEAISSGVPLEIANGRQKLSP